ncbi:MAG: hypothetical protein HW389_86 [Bacteroidetes bacterium]|nr:hypothetical protein [Bacteroidota bacterium]
MKSRSLLLSCLRSILLCGLLCQVFLPASAQYRVSASLLKPEPLPQGTLFIHMSDSLKADSTKTQPMPLALKSPATAVLLSAVLPGAGQIYTGRYWKVPIILGFGGYFGTQWFRMNDRYANARSKYQESVLAGENKDQGNAQLLYERDFYRDQRDRFAFYFAITYLLNLVDAYVGASLYNFDVGDNLSGGASLKISIPLR